MPDKPPAEKGGISPGGRVQLTQRERERALAHSTWEEARVEELSVEIKRLLDGKAEPVAATAAAAAAVGSEGGAAGGRSPAQPDTSVLGTPSAAAASDGTSRQSEIDNVLGGRDLSRPLNLYRVPDGIMQVFFVGVHQSSPINRPYVMLRLGDQAFQTSVSKSVTGDWNEGFELMVSYHTQLFGTVHMDVYSNNTLLPDTHIGRAEIKISLLEGFPEVFTSYYEIWDKNLTTSTVPDQRQRSVVSKNLGALQVRINYRFQKTDDPEPAITRVRGAHLAGALSNQQAGRVAAASGGTSGPAAMTMDELVAAFVGLYGQCSDAARRSESAAAAGSEPGRGDAGSEVGFARIDDDAAPPTTGSLAAASANAHDPGAKDGPGFTGWLFDMFAGQQAPAAANGAAAPAEPAADTEGGASGSSEQQSVAQPGERHKGAGEKTLMQSLTGMFVSPSIFMMLKSLERLVGLFNQGVELSSAELLGGLFALYRFHNDAEIPGVSRPHAGPLVEGVQALELPSRYARFALASYGWRALYFFNRGITLMDGAKVDSDVTSVLQYLRLTKDDLLGYEFRSSQLFCPSYFVAHDRPCSAVVLVVRGTMSAEDAVVDLACEYTKWNGGLIHSGMKASAHWLFVEVMPQIFAYASSHKIPSIRIVGHSLGGSAAAILTIMLHESRARLASLGVDIGKYDIKGYCYGPAPCVSDSIAERHRDCIYTYVNKDDLVPRLCYGSVSDFRRMSISAADEADNLGQLLYSPFEGQEQQQQRWKDRFSRLMGIRGEILASGENLHLALPGTIHHLVPYRDSGGKAAAPRDRRLEVAVAKRRLFGNGPVPEEEATPGASDSDGGPPQPPPPPPSTPATIVQQDAVDTDNLADAINSPIHGSFAAPVAAPAADAGATARASSKGAQTAASTLTAGGAAPAVAGDKFVPVWVQRVPSNAFCEIILRPTIIADHMPSAYEMALAHAVETQVYERHQRDRRPPGKAGTHNSV
ncbi:hypothetical protein LPJ61_001076 [Coemansia biformis]|uniref:sn-1-specific diacylglycerol lipase n=1 Tax=Coemansia biformis TaxID=1286918 RepID=A0A9W8D0F6_9FUNG|nr:hypothetical protein LPJ61_001076 [Coemansia biformis]